MDMKRFIFICIVVAGVAGCVTPARGPVVPTGQAGRIPADALFRLDPALRQLTIIASLSSHQGATWSYPVVVGPAFVDLLGNFVRTRFRSVTMDSSQRGHATVAFELVAVQPDVVEVGTMLNMTVTVTTRLTIADGAGRVVFGMTATGRGQRVATNYPARDASRLVGKNAYVTEIELATRSAIENMLQKFAVAINADAGLRKALATP